jgi:uncharacterized protein with GYD domain
MLFCITADYTPQAITAMRNNPTTSRREAVEQLLEAAGGKLVAMYGRVENGPGALVIFECGDPAMVPAIAGVAMSSGNIQNLHLQRLVTQEEIVNIRRNAATIASAYKPPGQ